jgi:hypothetical protein
MLLSTTTIFAKAMPSTSVDKDVIVEKAQLCLLSFAISLEFLFAYFGFLSEDIRIILFYWCEALCLKLVVVHML